MVREDNDNMIKFLGKNDHKVTKGQSAMALYQKKLHHEEYYLCGKFHAFTKKCIIIIFVLCCYTRRHQEAVGQSVKNSTA